MMIMSIMKIMVMVTVMIRDNLHNHLNPRSRDPSLPVCSIYTYHDDDDHPNIARPVAELFS